MQTSKGTITPGLESATIGGVLVNRNLTLPDGIPNESLTSDFPHLTKKKVTG